MYRTLTALSLASMCSLSTLATAVPAFAAPAPAQADELGATYKRLTDTVGPALVTVKFIMKIEAGGQMAEMFGRMADEGVETEVTGLMVEKDGLVLLSNTQLGGYFAMMAGRMGGGVTPNPTDLKVLIGDDTEGLKAKFLARDKDIDLAWVKIDDPKASGKTFAAVDLASNSSPAVGERLLTLNRKGKFFDHAMVVSEGRLGGVTKKPRSLLIPTGMEGGMSELGMPVFDSSGKLAGVSILQMPSREDAEGGDMSDLMSGGGMAVMILPASEVVKATARSKELAAKGETGDKKTEDKKPAEGAAEKPKTP